MRVVDEIQDAGSKADCGYRVHHDSVRGQFTPLETCLDSRRELMC
jgi:hypothetical protein